MLVSTLEAVQGIKPDICIVGAGAAGITLACELDGCGQQVVLLEAGGLTGNLEGSRESFGGTTTGRHLPPDQFRRFGFGGTTALWGGRCVPFDPIDFERREHVPHSGWPIAYDDVARHYPHALQYCDAGGADFDVATALPPGTPTLPGIQMPAAGLVDRIERYSLPTHFGKAYRHRLERSRNVTVVLGSRCVRLNRTESGRIGAVEVLMAPGSRARLAAGRVVLATGALETTRLLFVSDPTGPGLGNAGDRLGRFYQCHFANVCGELVTHGETVAFGFEQTMDGVYARRNLQFSPATQREHALLNTTFRLHFHDYCDASHGSGALSGIYLLKSMLVPEYQHVVCHGTTGRTVSGTVEHVRNVVKDAGGFVRFGADWLFGRALARRRLPYTLVPRADGRYPIEFNSEQIPLLDSRVTLAHQRDRHGMPALHIDWRTSDADTEACLRAFRLLQRSIAAASRCTVEFREDDLDRTIRASIPVGGHHIGTTRMAATWRDGVVDADCRVHGVPNLYVAGAAVFPTCGHANPTLTIVAMSLRLAEQLRQSSAASPWYGSVPSPGRARDQVARSDR